MAKTKRTSEERLERQLTDLLDRVMSRLGGGWAETFADAEISATNRGVVVYLGNGQEFHLTIAESTGR